MLTIIISFFIYYILLLYSKAGGNALKRNEHRAKLAVGILKGLKRKAPEVAEINEEKEEKEEKEKTKEEEEETKEHEKPMTLSPTVIFNNFIIIKIIIIIIIIIINLNIFCRRNLGWKNLSPSRKSSRINSQKTPNNNSNNNNNNNNNPFLQVQEIKTPKFLYQFWRFPALTVLDFVVHEPKHQGDGNAYIDVKLTIPKITIEELDTLNFGEFEPIFTEMETSFVVHLQTQIATGIKKIEGKNGVVGIKSPIGIYLKESVYKFN